jgi:hypothetical protein
MNKGWSIVLVSLIFGLFLTSGVLAISSSADSEVKKITYYAQEFETGNIDYVKLLVYTSSVRQSLNEILGATEQQMGGVLKQEKIKEILGEPTEETKWVWVEGEEQDRKLDSAVPVWRKIVFDGKKIQIRLEAFPSIFTKKQFNNEGDNKDKEAGEDSIKEGDLIYRLNFWIEFKEPKEQLDISGKIDKIKGLAEDFNSDPSQTNAEALAKESVNAERIFESYFKQNQGKCEDLMSNIFGSESRMPNQNMLVQEISFYEGDKFEVIARLEMCDDCEWNWINLDLWLNTRGPMPKMEDSGEKISPDQFKDKDKEYYKSEIVSLLDSYKKAAEEQNWKELNSIKQKLQAINEAWNQKANDVWKETEKNDVQGRVVVEKGTSEGNSQKDVVVENDDREGDTNNNVVVESNGEGSDSNDEKVVENTVTGNIITGNLIKESKAPAQNNQQSEESKDPYYWIKQDQERRKQEKILRKQNYEERKQFYLDIFSNYDKKEYSFAQIEFKKRLLELFKEKGEEVCDNNQDDNQNGDIDCDDEICGGKICGKGVGEILEGNETREVEVDFYCIAGECKAKEEIIEVRGVACGDHVCEGNETIETCAEDCALCPQYAPIECNGRVIFSGMDENNCSLEPTCIEEQICNVNEDCKFLCGEGECVEGECQVKELSECSEQECSDGTQKTMNCESGESIVSSICSNGLWVNTDLACSDGGDEGIVEEVVVEEGAGNQCDTLSDCGGENDVCSNGQCVSLPGKVEVVEEVEEEDNIDEPETNEAGENPEEAREEGSGTNDQKESEAETTQTVEESEVTEADGGTESEDQSSGSETSESEEPSAPVTGNVVLGFAEGLLSKMRIVGKVITGFEVGDEATGGDSGTSDSQETQPSGDTDQQESPPQEGQNPPQDNSQQPSQEGQQSPTNEGGGLEERQNGNEQNDNQDDERKEEDKKRREEQKERCSVDCNRPCIEKCIRDICGQEMECNIDEESKKCEGTCKPEDSCIDKCVKGEGEWWREFENKDEFKEQKGGFEVGGNCRTAKGKTEGFIWFGGWGDPFERIQQIKNKYYSGGNADWCKAELQSFIKQREEFEKGFNQEFANWFFEDYLANSAEDWEQAVSGIFELYWKNVDNQRELAFRMRCLDKDNINEVMNYSLINITYETEYGKLEYWEEVKAVKMPGMEEEVTIISPYMKTWIFPSKEFMEYEMKRSMKNHEFPGSPEDKTERKNEEGMTAEEKEMIRQDEKFMKVIRKIAEKYGGNLDTVVQFKDLTSNEVVFNIYAQVNENDIIKVVPMLPEEVPETDVTIEVDFEKIYELIYSQEKEMRGEQTESPPWDKKEKSAGGMKNMVNGVKMYFKLKDIMNSATFTPTESEKDMKKLFKEVFSMMMKGDGSNEEEGIKTSEEGNNTEEGIWESKEDITGQVIGG